MIYHRVYCLVQTFFMVEQEKHEAALYDLTKEKLNPYFPNLTQNNPQSYLMI
jgi:hypothetical protein